MAKKVVFGFSRPRNSYKIGALLIRVFQGWTPYSHVFVSWDVPDLELDCIFEAWGTKVQFRSAPEFSHGNQIVAAFEVKVSDERFIALRRKAHLIQGTPYANLENVGIFAAAFLQKIFRRPFTNPFSFGEKQMKCSELALDLLDDIKELGLIHNLDLDLVDVKDVFSVLQNLSVSKDKTVMPLEAFRPRY